MPSLEFDFEVFCEKCGAGLCGNCKEGRTTNRGMPFIKVEPCQNCLDKRFDDGLEEGYKQCEQDNLL